MKLALETISTCNRVCPTCLRNSYPDRQEVSSWFEDNLLSIHAIVDALWQFANMNFYGRKDVCLSHYNEPLMDDRIVDIATVARSFHQIDSVYLNTNGDLLTAKLAKSLDGILDKIRISTSNEKFRSLFQKTEVIFTERSHIATHFSPKFDVESLAEMYRDDRCIEPSKRIIINHRQQFLLCCEDIVGEFTLGLFPMISLEDYYIGKRSEIVQDLRNPGGRKKYEYCFICPKS